MLQDDERNLQEGTQLLLGLIDKHRDTKRNLRSTPSVEEAQAEPEARCESKGSDDASGIPEECPAVRHTRWSLWMGPGFSDSSEEEEEKETASQISDPTKNDAVESSVLQMPEFPSRRGSDCSPVNDETVDNRIPPEQEITPSATPLVPVNFQGFTSSKLLKSSKNKKRTIK